jgi:hypothetical protein
VSCGSRPASWCERALEQPHAQWLSAPGRARAFPRRLPSGSSWPHQAHSACNALNAYVTGHTWRMAGIKYVQDIDATGRRQYNADLSDIRNRQAIVQGDLTQWHSKAATVLGDPLTRIISRMGVMWQNDVIWPPSGHQHHHWIFLARVPLQYRVQPPWGHLLSLGAHCDRSIKDYSGVRTLKATQGNQEKSQCLSNTTPILPLT